MQSTRLTWFLALTVLMTLGFSAQAAAQTSTTTAPVAVNLPAGDDGWTTTNDGSTALRYDLNPIPAGFFGLNSNAVTFATTLGGKLIANSGGLGAHIDTIVRRMAPTGLLAVGSVATIPVDFQALHLESAPFVVTYSDGSPSETWKIVGGLSTAAAQPIGSMTISRDCNNGGSFSANLPALFVLRYIRVNPSGGLIIQDCGLGQCPQVVFQSSGAQWTLRSALGTLNIDPLPANVNVDVDADGIPDGATTIGQSNFQGGIQICFGGGGGSPECARVDHVANDTGPKDHSRSSHGNYAAGGDSDGDGLPDHCACEDKNGDGIDDDGGGHPCPGDEQPIDVVNTADAGTSDTTVTTN
jgi:hypothetical protein